MTNIEDEVTNQDFTGDNNISESVSRENDEDTHECITEVDNPITVKSRSHISQCPIPPKRTKRLVPNDPPPKTAAATVMEYLVKKNESTGSSPSPPQDPVDAFLSGIAPTLKKLGPLYWYYAKNDIFAAVQKYEFKQLMDQEQLVRPSLIPTSSIPSYSEQPSPACYQQSISTYSNPSYSQQSSSVENYHRYTPGNEHLTNSSTDESTFSL